MRELPRGLRTLLSAAFVSYLGTGLTLPFLFIYLHQVRGISVGVTGLLISGTSVLALAASPAAGAVVDRYGARPIAIGTTLMQVAGTTSLVFVHSVASALVPMVLFGISQGAWAAWNALIAVMAGEEARPRVFALNFQLLNLGIGIGAIVAGIAVHVSHPGSFVAIYLADAASDLLIVGALLALPAAAFKSPPEREPVRAPIAASSQSTAGAGGGVAQPFDDDPAHLYEMLPDKLQPRSGGGYRAVLEDRRMVRYLVSSVLLLIAGYGAVSAGAIGYATTVLHVSSRAIAWGFAANTAFIVFCQPIGLRLAGRMRRTRALQMVALFFACSWVVLLVAGSEPFRSIAPVLVGTSFVIFAAGEVLFSPVAGPLVNDLAPPELRGRYNALGSLNFSLGEVISPAIAGPMLGASLGREYLVLLLGFCAAAIAGFIWLRRSLTDEQDHAPEAAQTTPTKPTAPTARM